MGWWAPGSSPEERRMADYWERCTVFAPYVKTINVLAVCAIFVSLASGIGRCVATAAAGRATACTDSAHDVAHGEEVTCDPRADLEIENGGLVVCRCRVRIADAGERR